MAENHGQHSQRAYALEDLSNVALLLGDVGDATETYAEASRSQQLCTEDHLLEAAINAVGLRIAIEIGDAPQVRQLMPRVATYLQADSPRQRAYFLALGIRGSLLLSDSAVDQALVNELKYNIEKSSPCGGADYAMGALFLALVRNNQRSWAIAQLQEYLREKRRDCAPLLRDLLELEELKPRGGVN